MMIGNNGMIEGGVGGRSIMSLLVSIVLIKLKALSLTLSQISEKWIQFSENIFFLFSSAALSFTFIEIIHLHVGGRETLLICF